MPALKQQHVPPRPNTADLERLLSAVENELDALGSSMKQHDSALIERHASGLREALTRAIDVFTRAARTGQVPTALRARLMKASGQVAAQRESLMRATVALDSAMDVLLPRTREVVYAKPGPRPQPTLFAH